MLFQSVINMYRVEFIFYDYECREVFRFVKGNFKTVVSVERFRQELETYNDCYSVVSVVTGPPVLVSPDKVD